MPPFCHSSDDPNPWLLIDLGKIREITKIVVWNRGDNWQDRIDGATIHLTRETSGAAPAWMARVSKPKDFLLSELGIWSEFLSCQARPFGRDQARIYT